MSDDLEDSPIDIKLIEGVKEEPCIWDSSHPHFQNADATNLAWNEIAKACSKEASSFPEYDYKGRFKAIRKKFVKRLQPTDSNRATVTKPWALESALEFLRAKTEATDRAESPSESRPLQVVFGEVTAGSARANAADQEMQTEGSPTPGDALPSGDEELPREGARKPQSTRDKEVPVTEGSDNMDVVPKDGGGKLLEKKDDELPREGAGKPQSTRDKEVPVTEGSDNTNVLPKDGGGKLLEKKDEEMKAPADENAPMGEPAAAVEEENESDESDEYIDDPGEPEPDPAPRRVRLRTFEQVYSSAGSSDEESQPDYAPAARRREVLIDAVLEQLLLRSSGADDSPPPAPKSVNALFAELVGTELDALPARLALETRADMRKVLDQATRKHLAPKITIINNVVRFVPKS